MLDFGLGGGGASVGDVLGHVAAEEVGFLWDHAQALAVGGEVVGADVHAVDQDGAGGGVVEAGDEFDEGGLARAGFAHQGDGFAWGHVQGDVVQGRVVGALVGEAHVAELHLALQAGRDTDRVLRRFDRGRGAQEVADSAQAHAGLLVAVEDAGELLDRAEEQAQVEEEGQ